MLFTTLGVRPVAHSAAIPAVVRRMQKTRRQAYVLSDTLFSPGSPLTLSPRQWMTFHNASQPISSVEQVNGSQAMSGTSWHRSKRPPFFLLGLARRLGQVDLSSTTVTPLELNVDDRTSAIALSIKGRDPRLANFATMNEHKL